MIQPYPKYTLVLTAVLLLGCASGPDRSQSLDAQQFAMSIKSDKQGVVIDVRTPGEFDAGHIPGAKLIDFYASDFRSKIGSLDKTKHYYVYCRSGNRSGQTISKMNGMGFKHVSHLAGGMKTWDGKVVTGK